VVNGWNFYPFQTKKLAKAPTKAFFDRGYKAFAEEFLWNLHKMQDMETLAPAV